MSNSLTIHRTLGLPLSLVLRVENESNSFQYHDFLLTIFNCEGGLSARAQCQ